MQKLCWCCGQEGHDPGDCPNCHSDTVLIEFLKRAIEHKRRREEGEHRDERVNKDSPPPIDAS